MDKKTKQKKQSLPKAVINLVDLDESDHARWSDMYGYARWLKLLYFEIALLLWFKIE